MADKRLSVMRACAVWLHQHTCGRKPSRQVPSEKTMMSIVLYVVLQLLLLLSANFNSS